MAMTSVISVAVTMTTTMTIMTTMTAMTAMTAMTTRIAVAVAEPIIMALRMAILLPLRLLQLPLCRFHLKPLLARLQTCFAVGLDFISSLVQLQQLFGQSCILRVIGRVQHTVHARCLVVLNQGLFHLPQLD